MGYKIACTEVGLERLSVEGGPRVEAQLIGLKPAFFPRSPAAPQSTPVRRRFWRSAIYKISSPHNRHPIYPGATSVYRQSRGRGLPHRFRYHAQGEIASLNHARKVKRY